MHDASDTVCPAEAAARLREGWQAIDVRLAYERDEGRIAGDVHIELPELGARVGEIPRDRPVLIYCRSGSRSGMAVDALRLAGYDAYNLAGGMLAWVEADLPVEPGA